MTKKEHLEAAKGCVMDVEFQHEKMQGLLAFMVQVDETNPPDHEDTKMTLIVLQNLLGEARDCLKNFDHHYQKYQVESQGTDSTPNEERKGGEDHDQRHSQE